MPDSFLSSLICDKILQNMGTEVGIGLVPLCSHKQTKIFHRLTYSLMGDVLLAEKMALADLGEKLRARSVGPTVSKQAD